MFHRLEIKAEATNVADIYSRKIRGGAKTPGVINSRAIRPGDSCGPLNRDGEYCLTGREGARTLSRASRGVVI